MTVYVTVKLEVDSSSVEYTEEILHNMNYGFEFLNRHGENRILDSEIIEQEIVI